MPYGQEYMGEIAVRGWPAFRLQISKPDRLGANANAVFARLTGDKLARSVCKF